MDNTVADNDIDILKGDIKSLQKEIEKLNRETNGLSLQIESIQTTKVDQLHADFPIIDVSEEFMTTVGNSKVQEDDVDIEQNVIPSQQKLFDDSIKRFFDETAPENEVHARKRIRLEHAMDSSLKRAYKIVETKENILYENVFRMGGITAFPLNQYLFDDEDEILGIRFDIYSSTSRKFLVPHYAIVKKESVEKKGSVTAPRWSLYRHTLPVYLPLDELSLLLENTDTEKGLQEFANQTRNLLYKTQYKHDKIEFLKTVTYKKYGGAGDDKIITKVEKDLQCHKVKVFIKNGHSAEKAPHELDLVCDHDKITNINIVFQDVSDAKSHSIAVFNFLVGCSFSDFKKVFRKVLNYLINHNLI